MEKKHVLNNYSSENTDTKDINMSIAVDFALLEHFVEDARTALAEYEVSYADELLSFAETIIQRESEILF